MIVSAINGKALEGSIFYCVIKYSPTMVREGNGSPVQDLSRARFENWVSSLKFLREGNENSKFKKTS